METLRPIAQQALAQARDRKARRTDEALRCHDVCAARETKIAALQGEMEALSAQRTRLESLQCRDALAWMDGMLRSLQQEITARQQRVEAERERMTLLVSEIKRESCLLAFDPECDWKGYEDCDGRRILQRAWNGLGTAKKWQKEVLITVCFRCFDKGMQMPYSLLDEVWCGETPTHIWHDRDLAVCFFTVARNRQGGCPIPITEIFLEHKPFVITAVKFFPEVLVNNLIPERFWEDEDVFQAYTQFKPEPFRTPRWWNPGSNKRIWEDENFRALVSRFSPEIRGNKFLMLALVKVCGMCLRYITEPLSADLDIIRAASEENPASFLHAPPFTQQALFGDQPFMLHLLDRWPSEYGSAKYIPLLQQLYQSLPACLQADPDIVDRLLSRGLLGVQELSEAVPRNRDFWLSTCHHVSYSPFTFQLPEYRNDPAFMVLFRFDSPEEVANAIQASPHLAGDRSFWTAVIRSEQFSGNYELHNVIQNHAFPEIRQDRALMLLACKEEARVYQILDDWLQEDREIVEAITAEEHKYEETFFFMPLTIQSMHPDLTLAALRHVEDYYVELHQIAVDLWMDVGVMKAWLDNQCSDRILTELPEHFPEAMRDSEEFCLHATRHCYSTPLFKMYASEALRSKKEFMLKAVALNPICLFAGVGRLSKDFDIAAVAFSHQIYSCPSLFGDALDDDYGYESELEFLRSVATQAREKVITFEGFTQAFLFGFLEYPGADCALPMLSLLKRPLAEIAGVPPGSEVARLRVVSMNLLFMCMPDEDNLSMYCSEVPGRVYCGIEHYF